MSHFLVTKTDFTAFLELVNAKYTHEPSYRDCKYTGHIALDCGVDMRFDLTTLEVKPNGQTFYGRHDTWTHVQIDTWLFTNIAMTGKGSRGREAREQAYNIMSLLGELEGFYSDSVI